VEKWHRKGVIPGGGDKKTAGPLPAVVRKGTRIRVTGVASKRRAPWPNVGKNLLGRVKKKGRARHGSSMDVTG